MKSGSLRGTVLVAAVSASLAFAGTAFAQPARTLKMQSAVPPSATSQDAFKFFAERVDKLTGGSLKIEVHAAGQIVPPFEILDATSKKVIDGGHVELLPNGIRTGSYEERLKQIAEEYGSLDKEKVADAIVRIQKRLGGLETKMALQNLETGDIESCFRILLKYYDKLYRKALDNRDQSKIQLTNLHCSSVDARVIANKILTYEPLLK
jgi:hypothetical protein